MATAATMGRRAPLGRVALPLSAFLLCLLLGSCRFFSASEEPATDEGSTRPAPGPRPVGTGEPGSGCRNIFVKGDCEFVRVWPQASRNPVEGMKSYRVDHKIARGDEVFTLFAYRLRIREDREEDLRQYYTTNSPVPCEAHIITPPCNTAGTRLTLELEPPPWATVDRN